MDVWRNECPEESPQRHCENTYIFLHKHRETDMDIRERPGCFLMVVVVLHCQFDKLWSHPRDMTAQGVSVRVFLMRFN